MNNIRIKSGIYIISSLMMSSLALAPSLASIAKSFPDETSSNIQMLLSVPSLFSLISSFIIGKISVSHDKRKLIVIGMSLILLGGVSPYLYHATYSTLLMFSSLVGLGIGVIGTLNPSIISENFQGNDRASVMGKMAAFVSIGAVVFTVGGGFLAKNGWENNYLIYLIVLPLIIGAALCLPKDYENKSRAPSESKSAIKLNKSVFKIAALGFAYMLTYSAYPNNAAIHIASLNIGGSDIAGLATGVSLLGGLIFGLFFGLISRMTQTYTLLYAFALLAVGVGITSCSTTITGILLGSFIAGSSLSLFMARAPFMIASIVDHKTIPMAIAIYSASTSIAGFVSPLVINKISEIAFQNQSSKTALITAGLISLFVSITLLISSFEKKCILNGWMSSMLNVANNETN
jgi:MFS family permease